MIEDLEVVACEDEASWRDWLSEHHDSRPGVWLRLAKKNSAVKSVTFSAALDGAIAWGWIDNLKKGNDESTYLLRFVPRKPGGSWSKPNLDRVERLISEDRMEEPGLAAFNRIR